MNMTHSIQIAHLNIAVRPQFKLSQLNPIGKNSIKKSLANKHAMDTFVHNLNKEVLY